MMLDLTGFQRDLLYVIAGMDHPSGQQIKENFSENHGEIKPGRLYPNLDELVDRGYVEKGAQNRRKNYYTLTEEGVEEIAARREWENSQLPFEL